MKKLVIAIGLIAGLFSLVACSSNDNEEVIVETKAGDITKDEFYEELKSRSGEGTLQEMVTMKVLEDQFEVDEDEIDEQVDDAKEQLGDQFDMWLEQQGYGDEEAFRDLVRMSLLYDEAIYGEVEITDEEVKERYERKQTEIEAQHILVEDEETANEVKKKLDDGGDFAELAKEYSTDKASAEAGGNLDYFSAGKMVPEFEDAAYSMDVDTISDPVKTTHGFHIIKVTDKRDVEEDIGSFEDNEVAIRNEIKTTKLDQAEAQKKMDEILDNAKIDVKIKEFKDIFTSEG